MSKHAHPWTPISELAGLMRTMSPKHRLDHAHSSPKLCTRCGVSTIRLERCGPCESYLKAHWKVMA